MSDGLRVQVFDKDLRSLGFLGAPISATFTQRFNGQDTGSVVVKPDHRFVARMLDGQKLNCSVWFRDELLTSGPLRAPRGTFEGTRRGPVTLGFMGDWMHLAKIAYVRPGNPARTRGLDDIGQAWEFGPQTPGSSQYQDGYYRWPDELRSVESLVKRIVADNLNTRLGMGVEIQPDQGRGGDARAALGGVLPPVRMSPLLDVLQVLLKAGGLGLRIWHDGSGRRKLDVYEPRKVARALTAASGAIRSGSWSMNEAEVTRFTLGANGELGARAWFEQVDREREAALGYPLEAFTELTNAKQDWGEIPEEQQESKFYEHRPDAPTAGVQAWLAQVFAQMDKKLAEAAPTSSLDLTLAETKTWRGLGKGGLHTGDLVGLKVHDQLISDTITESTVTWAKDGKLTVTQKLGNRKDDPTTNLVRLLRAAVAGPRNAAASR